MLPGGGGGSIFFPFIVDPFSEGSKIILKYVPPLKVYRLALNDVFLSDVLQVLAYHNEDFFHNQDLRVSLSDFQHCYSIDINTFGIKVKVKTHTTASRVMVN